MPNYRIVFKRTSSFPKQDQWTTATKSFKQYISNYINEIAKAAQNKENQREKGQEGVTPPKEKTGALKSWNYLPLQEGVLWKGGFLGSDQSPPYYQTHKQAGWVKALTKEWMLKCQSSPKRRNNGIRVVFSLSDQSLAELTKSGDSPDIAVPRILRRTLELYAADNGWKLSDLGWVSGIHHDTDQFHIHTVLFPTTRQGQPLRLSNRSGPELKDHLDQFVAFANIAAEEYWRENLPYDVQAPETKLAWIKNEEPRMPQVRDFRSLKPAGGIKGRSQQEIQDIQNHRRALLEATKQAEIEVKYREKQNPKTIERLKKGPLEALKTPDESAPKHPLIQKLENRWITYHAELNFLDAITTKSEGKTSRISPYNTDPKTAERGLLLFETAVPRSASALKTIESELLKKKEDLETLQKGESLKQKPNEPLFGRLWNRLTQYWTKTKRTRTLNRINKTLKELKTPSIRATLLIGLEAERLRNENLPDTSTIQGLEEIQAFQAEEAVRTQEKLAATTKGAKTLSQAGQALLSQKEKLTATHKNLLATKTFANSIYNLLNPSPPETSKLPARLISGCQVALRNLGLRREETRSSIYLPKKGEPLPAFQGKPLSPIENPEKATFKPQNLRLPPYLDTEKSKPIFEGLKTRILQKTEEPPEITPGADPFQLEQDENQPQPTKEKSAWERLAEGGLLKTLQSELERRITKDKNY